MRTGSGAIFREILIGAAALVVFSAPAFADGDKDAAGAKKAEAARKGDAAKADPVSGDPQVTTASFGDWVERCQRIGAGPLKLCEVALMIAVEGQNAPFAQIAIGRADREGPLRLTLALPVNVSFTNAPRVKFGANGIDLAWRRCIPGACLADAPVAEADLSALRAAAEPGQVEFTTASGQGLKFPASARGLAQALDSLRREPVALREVTAKP